MLTSEFTTPLSGKPYYTSQGLIKVVDKKNRQFNIGEISFERFDEQNYQYSIKPYWNLIQFLPNGLFKGIPGINMELKKPIYYRVNMTPEFISMRTPSESREDISTLLSSVGLDYYDRFEWLLRSNTRCGDDNLIVVRKNNSREYDNYNSNCNNISPSDTITINNLGSICSDNKQLIEQTYKLLQSGATIYLRDERRFLENNERYSMLYLLKNMLYSNDANNSSARNSGIEKAKTAGKYQGRRPIDIDLILLTNVAKEFDTKEITESEAMKKLGINSRSTFYRKLKSIN